VYRSKLRQFIRYLESQHPGLGLDELDRPVIEAWLRHLAEKVPPLRNGTRRDAIIAVRAFLDRIYGWGWVEAPLHSLILKTDLPPEDTRLPRPLSQEVDQALRAELQAAGDLLSMALLLQRATGMRLGELCDLELAALEEIEGNRWQIRVPLGKLHTERIVPLDQKGAELFRKIRQARGVRPPLPHPETGKPTQFLLLWPGNRKQHVREKLQRSLACACKAARVTQRVTSHRFRHTYATELLRNGISLPALAKILGHRSIEMTLQYAQLVQEDVWRQYENARESMKSRYVIPASSPFPGQLPHQGDRPDIRDLLRALIARLEGLRRDKQVKDGSKVIRVLERLRRVARDLANVVR
jgi:site-specific recombinase XerD